LPTWHRGRNKKGGEESKGRGSKPFPRIPADLRRSIRDGNAKFGAALSFEKDTNLSDWIDRAAFITTDRRALVRAADIRASAGLSTRGSLYSASRIAQKQNVAVCATSAGPNDGTGWCGAPAASATSVQQAGGMRAEPANQGCPSAQWCRAVAGPNRTSVSGEDVAMLSRFISAEHSRGMTVLRAANFQPEQRRGRDRRLPPRDRAFGLIPEARPSGGRR
jgi:hypothetical protein